MGILKQQEEEALRREQEHRKSKDKGKQHQHSHNHSKPKNSGGGQKVQLPLIKSVITSYKFLLLVAEDAIVAAALAFVIWGFLSIAGVDEVTIPTQFGVMWAVTLGVFLVQTIIWKR